MLDNGEKRLIDYHNTTDYSDKIGAELFETSSKNGTGIKELFHKITMDFMEDVKQDSSSFSLKLNNTKDKSCCSKT